EAIRTADLVLVSVRRRTPPAGMMEALRAHLAAGKPLVGIRTASHAFESGGKENAAGRSWPNFDHEVLGGDYEYHYGVGRATLLHWAPSGADHPILSGVARDFQSASHLYRNRGLVPTTTTLLVGKTEDGKSETEPVAWVNTQSGRRVFYTSLGAPSDFQDPNFRRLLLNGVLWSLDDFIPPAPVAKR
ncbi:MAG: ThuA domain-containing protein, partial [Verrucomicrobia bacterium]